MRKILVCDHKFNVESISSSGSNIKFYGLNENISFYDNFDLVNPGIFLIGFPIIIWIMIYV